MTTIQTIGLVIAGVIVSVFFSVTLNGSELGGVYSITEQVFDDVVVKDDLSVGSSSATTSVNFGRMCATVYEHDGTVAYWTVSPTGSLATSSGSCN